MSSHHIAARIVAAAASVGLAVLVAGCGPSAPSGAATSTVTEDNPPGDIPDNQAFVPFTPDSGSFTVSVPEGWARSDDGTAIVFTDKLNRVRIETLAQAVAPSEASAATQELPAIAAGTTDYRAGQVSTLTRPAGAAVLITYQGRSDPDPVTGRSIQNAIERYEFWRAGQEVVLTLSGPVGADNVDPWRTITDSFRWQS